MRKIFTKKRMGKLWHIAIGFLMVVALYCIVSLVIAHELYQPCKEFSAANGAPYISGIDNTTGDYLNAPANSCRANPENTGTYENQGKYVERKSCIQDETGRGFITAIYEDCPLGCFAGTCMQKCTDPGKDNIFSKNLVTGFYKNEIGLPPGIASPSSHPDYCTNEQGTESSEISKYLAKGYCDSENFISKNIVECSGICLDGACQKNPVLYCKDSDQNDQGKVSGSVIYYNPNSKVPITLADSCVNDKTVLEYFCGKDKLPHKLLLTCRHSCSDGQCLP